jgi:hypothetical protein
VEVRMNVPFQCKCGCTDFLVTGETYKIVRRSFLWMSWLARVPSGQMLVLCSRGDCRLPLVVSLGGVRDPIQPDRNRRPPAEPDPEVDEFIGSETFEALPPAVRNAIKRGVDTTPSRPRDPLANAVRRPEV